jgi:hypothetical protein
MIRKNQNKKIKKERFEGWLSDGTECINFDAWMKGRLIVEICPEPFYKSDLNYGL